MLFLCRELQTITNVRFSSTMTFLIHCHIFSKTYIWRKFNFKMAYRSSSFLKTWPHLYLLGCSSLSDMIKTSVLRHVEHLLKDKRPRNSSNFSHHHREWKKLRSSGCCCPGWLAPHLPVHVQSPSSWHLGAHTLVFFEPYPRS